MSFEPTSFTSTSFTSWTEFLGAAIQGCQEKLLEILDAATVRELWLQGELYLAARRMGLPHLYVNYPYVTGYDGNPDLSYWDSHDDYAKLFMLGEMKISGTAGYSSKGFDGHAIREYLDELEDSHDRIILIEPSRLKQRAPLGGLLADYKKLIEYQKPNVLKLLILVLDTRKEGRGILGKVLKAVEFERKGRVVYEDSGLGIWCKAWEITGDVTT